MARRNGLSTPPRERSEQVYRAALRLFREKGYHATSMQDIAAAVGLYKGSLYHYIGGKEDLLVQVFERAMGGLIADVEGIAADTSLSAGEQVRLIIEAHVTAVSGNLDALTVFLHEWRALAGESLAGVLAQRERYTQLVSNIVSRGVRLGEFDAPDVQIATLGVLGMCNWVCQWYRPGGRLGPAEIASHFARLVLDGLRQPDGLKKPDAADYFFEPSTRSPSASPRERTSAAE
jgi:TetR/AcrR family transcriptional regulator, cholesterol catabolism regulator